MEKHAARPRTPARVIRWLWPNRNPLRRHCDRAEAVIMMALTAAFLTGAPLVLLAAGHWPHIPVTPTVIIAVLVLPFGCPVLLLYAMSASAVVAAMAGPLILAALLCCAGLAAHSLLDSRRLSAWEAEWSVAEPRWTTRP